MDVWPEFPLALRFYTESEFDGSEDSIDNLVAALEHCDRVRQIEITNPADFLWKKLVTAMEEPFPALRSLYFDSLYDEFRLPDTFLNGSAPCLRRLTSFLATIALVYKRSHIPNSGYIPPETMARCLSALPKLRFRHLNPNEETDLYRDKLRSFGDLEPFRSSRLDLEFNSYRASIFFIP